MKYIDADHLKVEIKKHIKEVKDVAGRFSPNMGFFDAKISGIYDVMALLDTLSEEPDKSLEEEIKKEMVKLPFFIRGKDQIAFARHFYDLGQSQMPMPEDTVLFQKGVAEGRRLEREDSVECEVTDVGFNYLDLALFDAESLELKAGDKIKVIVLKAEEQI